MHNSTSSHFQVGKRADLERVVVAAAIHAPHQLPLYRAARDGAINLVTPERGALIPKRMLDDARRPIIVLLGDDDYASTGPDGWACARRLRYWGRRGLIHAAAGKPEHYEAAVMGAMASRRFVLVETSTHYEAFWSGFLAPHMPCLGIRAPAESPQPAPLSRHEVH